MQGRDALATTISHAGQTKNVNNGDTTSRQHGIYRIAAADAITIPAIAQRLKNLTVGIFIDLSS